MIGMKRKCMSSEQSISSRPAYRPRINFCTKRKTMESPVHGEKSPKKAKISKQPENAQCAAHDDVNICTLYDCSGVSADNVSQYEKTSAVFNYIV